MIDLKWNATEQGINWNPPQAGEVVTDPLAWEPEIVEGDEALIQSFYISLRNDPWTRALYQAEPEEAARIGIELKKSLQANNPEIVLGSFHYSLDQGHLNIRATLICDNNQSIQTYFENVFNA
ncbi:MAG: hypothetical protein A2508_02560 [Candidatus Lambdaproteobacteria bacterium RIFOXYD12_FULL_49_8]|uniref:Uncharacterized protein n=1 Tax=Candidatus Lambdaproteobacteria bacterium RIFOXYD2_FULL_50_16 TaxID=1817772 RepID=A0A1F6G888_9PROT|nr:MAG: hypothetical protein A2527_00530 [Candidatus Lambdaproteobacteria bacterium RIFOXYD2_FULL_50_16]OGG98267.1 MAG: hypothetical protein A2508_02560 [Candidatus Lambdaproteobacteria bacterium RIFOXYD12_FULL_49_8]